METGAVLLVDDHLVKQREQRSILVLLGSCALLRCLARCPLWVIWGRSKDTSCGWCGGMGAVVSWQDAFNKQWCEAAPPQLASLPVESIRHFLSSLPALLKVYAFMVSVLMAVRSAAWAHHPRDNPDNHRAEPCKQGVVLNWKQLLKAMWKIRKKMPFCILEETKKEWRVRPVSSALLWRNFFKWKFECILCGLTSGRVENLGDSFGSRSEYYLHVVGSNVLHIFDLVRLYGLDQRKSQKNMMEPVSILWYAQHT